VNLDLKKIRPIVRNALREDIGKGDITTNLLVPEKEMVKANIVAKEPGVVAGIGVAEEVFRTVGRLLGKKGEVTFKRLVRDGLQVRKGETIAEVRGSARVILTGERTALNFLQHLSGIATVTRRYVEASKLASTKSSVGIYDTRKTLPGLRYLQKYAVACGGGYNHRMGLYDMVLVKDNHWRIVESRRKKGFVGMGLEQLRDRIPREIKVEIEVDNLRQLERVLTMDVDIIMLDNMELPLLKKALKMVKVARRKKGTQGPAIEVSGKIDLESIGKIAKLGVERVSIGEITHSVRALDIGLDIVE